MQEQKRKITRKNIFGVESAISQSCLPRRLSMVKLVRLELDMQSSFASLCKEQLPMTKVLNMLQVENNSAHSLCESEMLKMQASFLMLTTAEILEVFSFKHHS